MEGLHVWRSMAYGKENVFFFSLDFFVTQTFLVSDRKKWYENHIDIFLKTWNLLRNSVTSSK